MTRHTTGFIINNLGASQKAYSLIKHSSNTDSPIIIFYQNLMPPCNNLQVASMQATEIYGFHGPLIATCLSSAEQLITVPSNYGKYFYIWDLEWTQKQFHSEYLYNIFSNIKLIARCDDHAEMVSKVFNQDVEVIEDFNIGELCQLK